MTLVLTIDAGGSGVKAGVVCTRDWRVLAVGHRDYRASHPEAGHAEFDTQEWWSAMLEAAAEAVERAAAPPGRYLALTCTAMRIPFVLLDAGRAPLWPGVLNLDARGRPYLDEIRAALGGEALYALTGHWPAVPLGLPKLLWFKHRRPDVWARVATILQMHDWMLYELCGEMVSEPSSASMGQVLDVAHRRWATPLLEAVGIAPGLFPPLRDAGSYLGGLRPTVAHALNLLPGTPVHVGGGDTHMGCLGAGGVAVGDVVIVGGSTTPIHLTVNSPACHPVARPWVSAHLWPDRWAAEMNAGATGIMYKWLRDLCVDLAGGSGAPSYGHLDALAARAPLGAGGLLVTAANPRWSEEAWLRQAPTTLFGLSPGHTLDDVARATMESVCYAVRCNLEQLELVYGRRFERVLLVGGASHSQFWSQILADVLGKRVSIPRVEEASALAGARIVLKDRPQEWGSPPPTHDLQPDPVAHEAYQSYYLRYLDVHDRLGRAMDGAA